MEQPTPQRLQGPDGTWYRAVLAFIGSRNGDGNPDGVTFLYSGTADHKDILCCWVKEKDLKHEHG